MKILQQKFPCAVVPRKFEGKNYLVEMKSVPHAWPGGLEALFAIRHNGDLFKFNYAVTDVLGIINDTTVQDPTFILDILNTIHGDFSIYRKQRMIASEEEKIYVWQSCKNGGRLDWYSHVFPIAVTYVEISSQMEKEAILAGMRKEDLYRAKRIEQGDF